MARIFLQVDVDSDVVAGTPFNAELAVQSAAQAKLSDLAGRLVESDLPERPAVAKVNSAQVATARFNPDRQIALIWDINDVHDCVLGLTDAQAMDVLRHVERRHDANAGVSWETLRFWAYELYRAEPRTLDAPAGF